MKPTVCLAMIVRDEAAHLAACLDSVKGMVDEIVVVDTGSADDTAAIARRYTDRVYHYRWDGDFSATRNYALSHCSSQWILSLDADEQLAPGPTGLRELITGNPERETFFLPLYSYKEGASYDRFLVLRLFRNKPEYRFRGKVHEQIPLSRPEAVGIAAAPVILHRPCGRKERNRKRNRNLNLLKAALAEDPADCCLKYYLGAEWYGLGKTAKALPYFSEAYAGLIHEEELLFRTAAVRHLTACLTAGRRWEEALCICLAEVARYPAYTDLLYDGGLILEEQGEYEAAARWFQAAAAAGPPPPEFYHTNGTESFLALYHLGYCQEKLGRPRQAGRYYQQALAADSGYTPPLFRLFMLLLANTPARDMVGTLQAAGFLARREWAEELAGLFFSAGYPGEARACIEQAQFPDLTDAKFLVYGGQPGKAPACLAGNAAGAGELIVALILAGDLAGAKQQALRLWRDSGRRGMAVAYLNLISLAVRGRLAVRPEKSGEAAVIQTALAIFDNCLRGPGSVGQEGYSRLAALAGELLTQLSADGCRALAEYLQAKAEAARRAVDFRHGVRRLYQCAQE